MAFTSDWHRDMILDFQNSIKEKREPIASISSAIEVHRLISMLEYSSKTNENKKRGNLMKKLKLGVLNRSRPYLRYAWRNVKFRLHM